MNHFKKFKRRFLFYAVRLLVWLLNRVPRGVAITAGSWIGLLAWWLIIKDQHKMERHLTLVFKKRMTRAQRRNIGRAFYIGSGKNYADLIRASRHYKREISRCIVSEGLEHFERVYQRGKGVIGITGHIGNYELLAAYLSDKGFRVAIVAREIYEPGLNALMLDIRHALGIITYSTTDNPQKLIAWLRSGGLLGVLIDIDSSRVRSMPIPFFGRLANSPVGQSILALRTGAAVCPMACLRTEKNSYKIIARPEILLPERSRLGERGIKRDSVYRLTHMCNKALEEIIRANPEQWIWLHSRWQTKC